MAERGRSAGALRGAEAQGGPLRSGGAGRPGPPAAGTSGEANRGVQRLVVTGQRQQRRERVERQLQQRQRERERQEQRQRRPCGAGRLAIGPGLYFFRALSRQERRCCRNTRNTYNALAFEVDAEANLLALQQELRAHTHRPGRSIRFVTDGVKPRDVFAANFRDRIVHHLLVGQ